jgi:hypothetical protein
MNSRSSSTAATANTPTLIVHIGHQQPADLAQRIDAFLRENGARTERERHGDTDVRVLATLD